MKQTDEILAYLKQGDKRGFEILFQQFYRPLVMYAARLIGIRTEAEDIVEEVFIKFWEKSSFEMVDHNLRSYLYQSVHNHCLNLLEKNAPVKLESTDFLSDIPDSEMLDEAEWNARMDEIYREIDCLPVRTREIFVAVVLNGKHYQEVANELNISLNTVKKTLSRALATLRSNLSEKAHACFILFLSSLS